MKAQRDSYHHGNLRAALLDAAVALAAEQGPAAVGLREVARRVGVSATAAYRHFASHADLLAALRQEAGRRVAERMHTAMDAVAGDDPGSAALLRFRATGTAYMLFSIEEPGLFRTAMNTGRPDADFMESGPGALLGEALDALVALEMLDAEARRHAEIIAWASVHGLAMLLLDGHLPGVSASDIARDEAGGPLDRVLNAVVLGLLPRPGGAQVPAAAAACRPATTAS